MTGICHQAFEIKMPGLAGELDRKCFLFKQDFKAPNPQAYNPSARQAETGEFLQFAGLQT